MKNAKTTLCSLNKMEIDFKYVNHYFWSEGTAEWKLFTLFIGVKMFGLAAGENLGQIRPYNGVNSFV